MDDLHHSIDWYVGYLHRINEELVITKSSYETMIVDINKTDRYIRITVSFILVVSLVLILLLLLQQSPR